jgi:hypothetical protein
MACSITSRLSSGIEKSSGGAFLTNSARAAAIFLAVSRSTVWRFLLPRARGMESPVVRYAAAVNIIDAAGMDRRVFAEWIRSGQILRHLLRFNDLVGQALIGCY